MKYKSPLDLLAPLSVKYRITSNLPDGGLSPFSVQSKVLNVNLNAELFNGRYSIEFPRKAENATIFGVWNHTYAPRILNWDTDPNAAVAYGQLGSVLGSYVPGSRTITINGIVQDLTVSRTWNVGTVTSVGLSVPTGLSVAGSPVTGAGTLAVTFAAGYSIPTTAKQTQWDAAYTASHNAVTLGTANGLSLATQVLSLQAANGSQPGAISAADWTTFNGKQAALSGTGLVKSTAGVITYITDNSTLWNNAVNRWKSDVYAYDLDSSPFKSGVYVYGSGSTTGTLPTGFGSVFHFNGNSSDGDGAGVDWGNQIAIGTSADMYFRQRTYNYNPWSAWRRVWASNDFSSADIANWNTAYSMRHNAVTLGTANGLSLSTQVLSLQLATSGQPGALSAADWTTFNGKQAALSGTGLVKSVAGTISYITDNSANWDTAFGYGPHAGLYFPKAASVSDFNSTAGGPAILQANGGTVSNQMSPGNWGGVFQLSTNNDPNHFNQIGSDINGTWYVRTKYTTWGSWYTVITTQNAATLGYITASSTHTLTNKSGNISQWTNDSGYVTPTSSSAFTNKTGNISQWTNDQGYITASSTNTLTNKSGNISQWTNDMGYVTSSGITGSGSTGYIMKFTSGSAGGNSSIYDDGSEVNFNNTRSVGFEGVVAARNTFHAHKDVVIGSSGFHGRVTVHNVVSATLNSSAILDLQTTTRAFYPPRMTCDQKHSISGLVFGATVIQTNTGTTSSSGGTSTSNTTGIGFYHFNGLEWRLGSVLF